MQACFRWNINKCEKTKDSVCVGISSYTIETNKNCKSLLRWLLNLQISVVNEQMKKTKVYAGSDDEMWFYCIVGILSDVANTHFNKSITAISIETVGSLVLMNNKYIRRDKLFDQPNVHWYIVKIYYKI